MGVQRQLPEDGGSSDRLSTTFMATLSLRLLGLCLLILVIVIPSCQAVFPHGGADAPRPFQPGFVRD
jgi:hypothetical protein